MSGWRRQENRLRIIKNMQGWVSPRLDIRFELSQDNLEIFTPNGQKFLTYVQLGQEKIEAEKRAEKAEARVKELEAKLRELDDRN